VSIANCCQHTLQSPQVKCPPDIFKWGDLEGKSTRRTRRAKSTYDDKDLASVLAGPASPLRPQANPQGPVEIILGIKKHGSSHLLVTVDQAEELTRQGGIILSSRRYHISQDFESLSPIYFNNVEALTKKLSHLKPKATKNSKGQDTSQANRIYDPNNIDTSRAAFEHGRVLNSAVNAAKYGVDNLSWAQHLRICSFVFNVRGIDDRKLEERLRNPLVLDVGFCEASIPSLDPIYSTARHIIDQRNVLMGGNRKVNNLVLTLFGEAVLTVIMKPFAHGQSQKMHISSMRESLQEYFNDYRVRSGRPMILLVYNQELTLNYLRKMDVDTSAWSYDLKALLSSSSHLSGQRHRGQSYDYSGPLRRPQFDRSRSRSPRPRDPRAPYHSPSSFQSNRSERYDSPSFPFGGHNGDSNLYPPVCLVDVQQLYVKLMTNDQVRGVVDIARHFGITGAEGICAGNEAGVIIKIWKDMVTGLAIDEQRQLRSEASSYEGHASAAQNSGPSDVPVTPLDVDSDDEQDPNDIVAQPAPNSMAKQAQQMSFEDESDYGEYDSDDDSD
ncbi:hypothetical protein CVT25_009083, partial [Psilocybe cyanescens]